MSRGVFARIYNGLDYTRYDSIKFDFAHKWNEKNPINQTM